jgi:hypothetical protein
MAITNPAAVLLGILTLLTSTGTYATALHIQPLKKFDLTDSTSTLRLLQLVPHRSGLLKPSLTPNGELVRLEKL